MSQLLILKIDSIKFVLFICLLCPAITYQSVSGYSSNSLLYFLALLWLFIIFMSSIIFAWAIVSMFIVLAFLNLLSDFIIIIISLSAATTLLLSLFFRIDFSWWMRWLFFFSLVWVRSFWLVSLGSGWLLLRLSSYCLFRLFFLFFFNLTTVTNSNLFSWFIISIAFHSLNLLAEIKTTFNSTKHDMLAIQMRSDSVCNEELRSISVSSSICHGQ